MSSRPRGAARTGVGLDCPALLLAEPTCKKLHLTPCVAWPHKTGTWIEDGRDQLGHTTIHMNADRKGVGANIKGWMDPANGIPVGKHRRVNGLRGRLNDIFKTMLSPFVAACYRQAVPHTPVWFMRQAGRYMPEYRRLREKHSILELCKNPALAAEVTLQPIDALGVDAAIIFADLLLPLEPMGLQIEFSPGNGPVVHNPVRSDADVEALETHHASELAYVGEAISKVKKELHGRVPVIGFVGAPFTLASYMIEGGASRHFLATKRLMYEAPETWHRLMHKIVDVLAPYAATQVAFGAEAMQVFDSWVGALSPADYEQHVLPFSRMLVRQIQTTGVPVIHFGTGAGGFLKLFHEAGAEVLGLDWRVRLDDAWSTVGEEVGVQGNLDPAALFAPLPELKARVDDVLRRSGSRHGYIFNLGHGILPETPVENVKAVVEMVHSYERLPAVETPLLKR